MARKQKCMLNWITIHTENTKPSTAQINKLLKTFKHFNQIAKKTEHWIVYVYHPEN